VPTDFSEPSYYGLDAAAEIARKTGAQIHIFNACEVSDFYYAADPLVMSPPASIMIEGINDQLQKTSNSKLNLLKKRASLKGLKVSVSNQVTPNVHNAITAYAETINADMIVMGSHGAGNLKEIILGSTAERVVRFAVKPVIVIPVKPSKGLFRKIIFASDFSEEAYRIFPFVKEFGKINSSEIHLLKINTMDQFSRTIDDRRKINDFSRKYGGKYVVSLYNDYMKEEGILNYANEVKADLIAIGTHGKRGLRRFFSEDVSEGIVRLSHIPILIVNLKKQRK
ncbi:MAG TPA: universal stress protein, partial [Ignavibacteria bacterium]|nr:universal stress protein [Ignavibacteria bacterium]